MIDLDQQLRPLTEASSRLIADPARVRARAAARRRRRHALGAAAVAALLVTGSALVAVAATRGDGGRIAIDEGPGIRSGEGGLLIALRELPEGVRGFHVDGYRFFVRREGSTFLAFVDDAQHLPDESLWWCPAEGLFAAPTHGETFGPTGTKVAGPAQRDLAQYATSVQGEDLAIDVSRVVPGHVNDTSAGPPGEGRPWNSGPNSFCDGAVSTDGPVPRVGSTSPGPSSVPPNTSGEATAETTPTVGGTTTTPTPEGRNGWQELEAAVGLSATTVNTGDSIDAVLTIRNPNSYAVTASVAILEPNLLLTHASGTPSYRFFAWPPLEWPNRIHDSIRFDPGQVITVSGHVTLSDEEGAVGPGTYSAQAIMTSHMVPVAWEVRQEPTSLIVQEP